METEEKQIKTMPHTLTRGIGKFVNKDEGISLNMRIVIIICIFSLILVTIGTIILLNSYNPKAKTLNSYQVKKTTSIKTALKNDIVLPTDFTKSSLYDFESQTAGYTQNLNKDEQEYEQIQQLQ